MKLKGTETEKNLQMAFAGESQAFNKYGYYAEKAKKDGYEEIAEVFEETARNEKEHAKLWFKFLHNDEIPSTEENLKDAAAGEHYEWTDMYANMAAVARKEGFDKIAYLFESVGKIEAGHEIRYNELEKILKAGGGFEENVEEEKEFTKVGNRKWRCNKCGFTYEGEKALDKCPICEADEVHQRVVSRNYKLLQTYAQ
ncbi:MAG: rubrerythrin family protein [Eubacteriaceae bacterium]